MTMRGPFLAGLAVMLLSTTSALAADLGGMKGGSMKDDGYMPAIHQPSAARFYLRGDYSHAWQNVGGMYEPPMYDLSQVGIGNTNSWGLGVGYYFSKQVRGDFTMDFRREAKATGSVLDPIATVMGERQFGIKNMVGLFNLYYDFDTRTHFTPYLGVGLGFARNTTTNGRINVVTTATDPCDPAYAGGPIATCEANFQGATKWSTAAAVMAGFSARLHDRLHLDAGYRFLYLGSAQTSDITITHTALPSAPPLPSGLPTSAPDPKISDLSAHEFRVGLRWDIK